MRTTINLPDDLLSRAKQRAAATHRTLTAVMEDALRAALDHAPDPAPAQRTRLVTHGAGGTRAGVDLDDGAALLDLMDERGDPD